jgi:putative OPT family oligopeptide transporter
MRTLVVLTAACMVIVAWLYRGFSGSIAVAGVALAAALVMSFFFTAVASYIVGLVGNSNSPVSGMTITAVLVTGLSLSAMGYTGMRGAVAILGVAAIVCSVACTAGDVCNDLKTGHMVGATPWRQQAMELLGVLVAAFVMAPVLRLLHHATEGGIGGRELPAPQAGLFASLARALAGEGELPMNMVILGAAIGVAVIALDGALERRGSTFRAHLMPIAVGIYLPFGLAPPIVAGGLLAYAMKRGDRDVAAARQHRATLFASGVIAGESLMGIGVAGLAVAGLPRLDLGVPAGLTLLVTTASIAVFLLVFRRESLAR